MLRNFFNQRIFRREFAGSDAANVSELILYECATASEESGNPKLESYDQILISLDPVI